MTEKPWPLFALKVITPRLELRYIDDALGVELADLAAKGIHDPGFMPFAVPWTDATSEALGPNTLQYYWLCQAETSPTKWILNFAVIVDGTVIGSTTLTAMDFPILKQFETGSWLGLAYHGQGLGRELREATLHLGFAGLGATRATTAAFEDNAPSLGVTRSLGYQENGIDRKVRRGAMVNSQLFALDVDDWEKRLRRTDISIENLDDCLPMLGLG